MFCVMLCNIAVIIISVSVIKVDTIKVASPLCRTAVVGCTFPPFRYHQCRTGSRWRRHIQQFVTVHRCLQNKAPRYLVDCCIPVSDVTSRQHLRSASLLTVPRFRRNTFGRRAFSVGGPMAWNSLPDSLRDPSHCSSFRRNLKTVLFARY